MISAKLTKAIKELSDDYNTGSELLNMMEYYGVTNLRDITEEQAKAYYEMISKRIKEDKHDCCRK